MTSAGGDPPGLSAWRAQAAEIGLLRDGYRRRAQWHKAWFWASGVLVILMSTALPALAGFGYDGKDVTLAILGAAIAALTALRSFFHWDQSWALLRQADLDLTHLLRLWELEAAAALRKPEDEQPVALEKAAEKLLEKAEVVRQAESSTFFSRLGWPKDG